MGTHDDTFVVTPPAEMPVTLAEAHAWLRNYSGSTHDDLVVQLAIGSATERVERIASCAFVTRTLRRKLDRWPDAGRTIELPWPPTITVASVKYLDANGVEQTLSAGDYEVAPGQDAPGRVVLKPDKSWPELANAPHAVRVEYSCGYGTSSQLPESIKQAVLVAVEHVVDRRGLPDAPELEAAIVRALGRYKRVRFA